MHILDSNGLKIKRDPAAVAIGRKGGGNSRAYLAPEERTILAQKAATAVGEAEGASVNLFVGNLSFNATEQELVEIFSQYGNVERVKIVTDRDSGQPRGFAFVEMTDGGTMAIERLNGAEFHGRALNVNEARPKPDSGGRGGGRDRGYGGGNRGSGRGRW